MTQKDIDAALEWADQSHFNMNQAQEDHVNTIATAYENLVAAYRELREHGLQEVADLRFENNVLMLRGDALADAVEEFKMQMADEGELFRALDKYRRKK